MKIELAVYTAQEGYAWQPGTALTPDDLRTFKAQIGKFPSPDAPDFPFGGVFLADGRVVFYRYHLAKKIDFCGRDALYCVLGALPKEAAAQVDPQALFALPAFAGVLRPFPTEAELAPCEDAAVVPAWLKNLDTHSLDVRLTGTLDNLQASVKQELPPKPEPVEVPPPAASPRRGYRNRLVIAGALLVLLILAGLVAGLFLCRPCGTVGPADPSAEPTVESRNAEGCATEEGVL